MRRTLGQAAAQSQPFFGSSRFMLGINSTANFSFILTMQRFFISTRRNGRFFIVTLPISTHPVIISGVIGRRVPRTGA